MERTSALFAERRMRRRLVLPLHFEELFKGLLLVRCSSEMLPLRGHDGRLRPEVDLIH